MPFKIVQDDIVNLKVDAVVNAANTELLMGGGVCGAIFRAAGADTLQAACASLAPIRCGEAVLTPGFGLNARFIIHAAGPIYRDGKNGEPGLLRSCYANALKLAQEHSCASIAFPLISSGIYGYPLEEALAIATSTIGNFLLHEDNAMTVILAVFDKKSFVPSKKLLDDVAAHLAESPRNEKRERGAAVREFDPSPPGTIVNHLHASFSQTLLNLVDSKNRTDAEVCRHANLDRNFFPEIRTLKNYSPAKKTALALAVALELDLDETKNLLERAGYVLSPDQKFDTIVEYFITNHKYDIFEINEVLFYYDEPLLGG